MEKQGFGLSMKRLDYAFSTQETATSFLEEYELAETPSVHYLNLKYSGETYIPVEIFQNKLTPFQAIIKYLRDYAGFSNKKISLLLNKDIKSVWNAYQLSKNKPLKFDADSMQIPVSIFSNDKLSSLEIIVVYLKNLGMNFAEIARLLHRDQRTIWTAYSRANKKLATEKDERH